MVLKRVFICIGIDSKKKKKKFFIYFTYLGNNQGENKKKTTRHNGGQLGGVREERKKSNKDPVNYILVVQMIVSSPFLWNHIESVNRWWINKNKEDTEFPFLNSSVFVRFFFFLPLFPHMYQFGWMGDVDGLKYKKVYFMFTFYSNPITHIFPYFLFYSLLFFTLMFVSLSIFVHDMWKISDKRIHFIIQ